MAGLRWSLVMSEIVRRSLRFGWLIGRGLGRALVGSYECRCLRGWHLVYSEGTMASLFYEKRSFGMKFFRAASPCSQASAVSPKMPDVTNGDSSRIVEIESSISRMTTISVPAAERARRRPVLSLVGQPAVPVGVS